MQSDLRNLIGNSRGFGCLVFLFVLALAFVAWQTSAHEQTAVYIQHVTYRPNTGVAWLAGTQEDAAKLGAFHYYACCSDCPDPGGAKIPVLRPGAYWADCPADYDGYLLVGNEGEYGGQQDNMTPEAMADFILDARASHPDAIFVCLNSYLISYALDVVALLPAGTCEIYGLHTPVGLQDVAGHLDQFCQDCRIWLTEIYGLNNVTGAYDIAYEETYQMLADPRVERIFWYTAVNAHHPSLNAVKSDGSLYPNGAGFRDAIKAYP